MSPVAALPDVMARPGMTRFEPALYSNPDLHFLLDHLGEAPIVAFRSGLPAGTHRRTLQEALDAAYQYELLAGEDSTFAWAGLDLWKDAISRVLNWQDVEKRMRDIGAKDVTGALITHPGHYIWDSDGSAYKGGVGADAIDMVRNEILDDGTRRPFGFDLARPLKSNQPSLQDVAPWIAKAPIGPRMTDEIKDVASSKDARNSSLTCSICDFSQQYDRKDRKTRNLAMSRMHKHLKDAKTDRNRHRVLLSRLAH